MVATPQERWRSKPMNNLQLADSLCADSLALRDIRRIHIKNFGALIPHVFMSNVLARVGSCLLGGLDSRAELARILESLELGMTGDRETRNVIAISFVGDSVQEPFFEELKPLLGPKVRAQLQAK